MKYKSYIDIDYYAKILWDYHHLNQKIKKSKFILGFGSHDINVAKKCAKLYLDGFGEKIIFTGGFGRITKDLWNMTESEKFKQIAVNMGVCKDNIIIENKATNTGENIINTKELLKNINLSTSSFIVVDKPYRERRTYATLKKQWPELNFIITSPNYSYKEYCEFYSNGEISKNEFISIMVGDLQRIDLYSKTGFQIEQYIPDNVLDAYNKLIDLKFNSHLCK